MKSRNFRILTDDDGKQYRFDSDELAKILAKISTESKTSGEHKTQGKLMEDIADRACMSCEAVRNWKQGYNGPGSMEQVRACAEVLGIDYHKFLISIESQEAYVMNEKERKIIEKTYADIVGILYGLRKLKEKNSEVLDKMLKDIYREISDRFTAAHLEIDAVSISISDVIRYKLHRILIEVQDYLCVEEGGYFNDRWINIEHEVSTKGDDYSIEGYLLSYYIDRLSRKEGIETHGIWFIFDEILLAEKLGMEYVPIPDEYMEDADLDGENLKDLGVSYDEIARLGYRFSDNGVVEITPQTIFLDTMVKLLKDIFGHDFPDVTQN